MTLTLQQQVGVSAGVERTDFAVGRATPVAMKRASPDVSGGQSSISTSEDARAGFGEITNGVKQHLPGARLLGVELHQMASGRIEWAGENSGAT